MTLRTQQRCVSFINLYQLLSYSRMVIVNGENRSVRERVSAASAALLLTLQLATTVGVANCQSAVLTNTRTLSGQHSRTFVFLLFLSFCLFSDGLSFLRGI